MEHAGRAWASSRWMCLSHSARPVWRRLEGQGTQRAHQDPCAACNFVPDCERPCVPHGIGHVVLRQGSPGLHSRAVWPGRGCTPRGWPSAIRTNNHHPTTPREQGDHALRKARAGRGKEWKACVAEGTGQSSPVPTRWSSRCAHRRSVRPLCRPPVTNEQTR